MGLADDQHGLIIGEADIVAKLSNVERGIVPAGADVLTAAKCLYQTLYQHQQTNSIGGTNHQQVNAS